MLTADVVIVGGGISGLSALHFIGQRKPDLSVTLYEKENRLGGTIGTDQIEGFSFDWGPNGFLDREPLTLRLCEELGFGDRLERAGANVSNRFILRKNKLRSVPMSPPKFLMSSILSWPGKLRLLYEPWAKERPAGIDESIYDFVKRRIGTEAADYLVQPMVSGVYGGVASRLSLKSCFPIMREMEDEYGSLFKAMIAKAKKVRAADRKSPVPSGSGGPSGPGGWLTSFKGGLSVIIEKFEELYRDQIRTSVGVVGIKAAAGGYELSLSDGDSISSKQVVLSLPANHAARIVKGLSDELSESLGSIDYAPIDVVCMGFPADAIRTSLDGFGFLVPSKENRRILGSIWTSSIFDQRAPKGQVQLRTMVGGDGDHETAKLSEPDLVRLVMTDLDEILGITGQPSVVKTYRWQHGIPQFKIGHEDRVKRIEEELARMPGLHVTGNAYYGIGLNDCVKQSYRVAETI